MPVRIYPKLKTKYSVKKLNQESNQRAVVTRGLTHVMNVAVPIATQEVWPTTKTPIEQVNTTAPYVTRSILINSR